jgi:hypothetical protein
MLFFKPSYIVTVSSVSSVANPDRLLHWQLRQDTGYNNLPNLFLCPSPQHTHFGSIFLFRLAIFRIAALGLFG